MSLIVSGYLPGGPDALVIFGAGRVADWSTEIELANPSDQEQFGTIATVTTPNQLEDCPGSCIDHPYRLPPNGTTTVELEGDQGAPEFVGTYYVVPDAGGVLPVAAARALHSGVPSHSLPVYRLNTLLQSFVPNAFGESGAQVLLGARRSAVEHSNLLLSVLQPPGTVDRSSVPLRVEVLDGSGAIVGTHDYRLAFGESRVIGDVVGALGVESLDLGQIRVTQTGGTNIVRAALATALDGGAVTVTAGTLPELGPIPDPAFDSAVIVGAGAIGDWDTEILLGDSAHFATDNVLSTAIPVREPACEEWVADSATIAVTASGVTCLDPGSNLVFANAAGHAPEAAARIFDRIDPRRSADLPVCLTRQLVGIDLVFPFEAGRQNLFLAEGSGDHDATAHVEVRNADGEVVGSMDERIPAGGHVVIADVLAAVGAADSFVGQIDVSAIGDGYLRGALATLGEDDRFVVTAGTNP
ncbi:MAG TPA: hypothetical protein VFL12_00315 [Thermoanaerobaculia bacterium]|nr:hypothetical protein [Thermoanaerobaculia bacterium]